MEGLTGWLPDSLSKYTSRADRVLAVARVLGSSCEGMRSQCSRVCHCDRRRHTRNKYMDKRTIGLWRGTFCH